MVVDPNSVDYESDSESDDRQSDGEINELDGKNVSMCKFCDHAFTDKVECTDHELTAHNVELPYSCSTCSMNFADRLVYSAHMKSVHKNDKPYNCPQCDRTFARRSDLRKHTIVHTGVKPFTCHVCQKSFSRNTNLSKHMRIHSGTKPFVCIKCPRTFTSRGDLNRHLMIHTGQRPFRCNYCHLSFSRKDKLHCHERRHWPEQNAKDKSEELKIMRDGLGLGNLTPFLSSDGCELGESEKRPDDTNDESKMYDKCDYIERDDLDKSESNIEDRPYECTSCPKRFSTPDNLKYHLARHTGIRPFSCHVCSKSFIRKRELDRHVVTHTGLKPFKCPKCMKSFGRKDKLVRHMRIHDKIDGCSSNQLIGESEKIRKPIYLQNHE